MDLQKLKEPFQGNDLEWRVQHSGFKKNGSPFALVVPYVDARAIMNRLDEVAGPENWATKYEHVPGGVMCALSIKCGDEWVTKTDGAEVPVEDDKKKDRIDPVKSSLTNAFKRAAVQWGIARELYAMGAEYAVFVDNGRYQAKIRDDKGNYQTYQWNAPGEKSGTHPPSSSPENRGGEQRKKEPAGAGNPNQRKEIWDMLLDLNGGDMKVAGMELGRLTLDIGGKEERFFSKIDQAIVTELHKKVRERHEREVR